MIMIPGARPAPNERTIIGRFSETIINLLSLNIDPETPIYLSSSNREHMMEHHPDAYQRYFDHLPDILSSPDYIGIGGVQAPSVEFIKRFEINNEFVNVAVRASKRGVYFTRSMFTISETQIDLYLKKGTLKKLTNC